MDMEKVIKGLETIRFNLRQMNHGLLADFCDDAIALLKEQEAHKNSFTVIDKHTGKYPNVVSIARRCKWAKNLIYCDIDQFVIGEDGTLMLTDDCGNVAYCPADRFEVIWDACQNAGKGYCGERMDN